LEKIDVVMPALNSISKIGEDVFRKVLRRVFTEILMNRLIVVDDRSKDKTLDALKEFDGIRNVYFIYLKLRSSR